MGAKHTMTAEQAATFERRSLTNEVILAQAAADRGCDCQAYRDWFTYNRWQAQGYQVQKGEKGVRLTTFLETERTDEKTGKVIKSSRPWSSVVFCRCQVKPKAKG